MRSDLRICHLPDLHVGIPGREAAVERSLSLIIDGVYTTKPDAVVIPGDLMDGLSSIADRNLLGWFLFELSLVAPVFVIPGNHDRPGDLRVFGLIPRVTVYETPTVETVLDGRLLLMALPHLAKGALVTEGDIDGSNRDSEARIREILADFGRQREAHSQPALLMCHLDIRGRQLSNGETRAGQGIAVSVADLLSSGADYIAAGHIHMAQQLDPRLAYGGSAARGNFGEADPKSWNIVTLQGKGALPVIERQPLPLRPMFTVERTLDNAAGTWSQTDGPPEADIPADAEVRVRLVAPETRMAEIALERATVLERWGDAKVEAKTIRQAAVRSEAIGRAETEDEMLRAYWAHESVETPSPEFQGRALGALAEILQEVGA